MKIVYRICDLCKKKISQKQPDDDWVLFKVHIGKNGNATEPYFPYGNEVDELIDLCPECATKVGRDGLVEHLYTDEDYL